MGRVVTCESQSGLDGRLLLDRPQMARELKLARFRNPRIAWTDGSSSKISIRTQLTILARAGSVRRTPRYSSSTTTTCAH